MFSKRRSSCAISAPARSICDIASSVSEKTMQNRSEIVIWDKGKPYFGIRGDLPRRAPEVRWLASIIVTSGGHRSWTIDPKRQCIDGRVNIFGT